MDLSRFEMKIYSRHQSLCIQIILKFRLLSYPRSPIMMYILMIFLQAIQMHPKWALFNTSNSIFLFNTACGNWCVIKKLKQFLAMSGMNTILIVLQICVECCLCFKDLSVIQSCTYKLLHLLHRIVNNRSNYPVTIYPWIHTKRAGINTSESTINTW